MSYPANLPTKQVSFGSALVMEGGAPLAMTVTISATRSLVHRPTGTPLIHVATRFTSDGAGAGVVTLPICDSPNMGIGNGTSIVLTPQAPVTHLYTAQIRYFADDTFKKEIAGESKNVGPFALLASSAQISDIDDLLVGSPPPVEGIPVVVPATYVAGALTSLGLPADADELDQTVSGNIDTPGSATHTALTAAIAQAKRLQYINVYDTFFNGEDSLDNPAIWENESHLNATGLKLWADHIMANADISGTAPKVVWFGDSWVAQSPAILTTATTDVIPGATVVASGVAGNTSTQMLARFDADVPADADYVIFNEPGVNDCVYTITDTASAKNLEALVAKVRGIGAVPIFTGMVPLSAHVARSTAKQFQLTAQIGDGTAFPGTPSDWVATRYPLLAKGYREPEIGSLGLGDGALQATTTGTYNTAVAGYGALATNTTGAQNVAIGYQSLLASLTSSNNTAIGYQALLAQTAADGNVAIGSGALRANLTGSGNVGIGFQSLRSATTTHNTAIGNSSGFNTTTGNSNTSIGSLGGYSGTTGSQNVNIGYGAGYVPNGVAGNASTTASGQVCIGYQAGQSSATQVANIVAIGRNATAGGTDAVSVGSGAVAGHASSVALGSASSTTAANQVMLGDRDVELTSLGVRGIVMKSPDGTRYRVTVANGGTLAVAPA